MDLQIIRKIRRSYYRLRVHSYLTPKYIVRSRTFKIYLKEWN